MVEANIPLRPLHISILGIHKVFEPLLCCLKGTWAHPYTVTLARLAPYLGSQGHLRNENDAITSRVVYQIGIFWSVSVGISRYLPYRYQQKTRSVQFGIKKGAIAPFFPQKGSNGPLFKELCPPFEEKRGERYKKGGMIPTEIPKAQQI